VLNKRKGYLWGLVLVLLCSLVFALPALAEDGAEDELGIMPMGLTGKVQWTDQKLVTEGDVKVFIGAKEVGGGAIMPDGMFGVLAGKDPEDNGKKLSFVVIIGEKEYPAVALPEEIICAQGALKDNVVLAIEKDKTSGGGGGGGSDSDSAPAKPFAAPYGGTYKGSIEVSLATTTSGAVIYYTTDGSNPKESVTRKEYTEPFKVGTTTVVRAVAFKDSLSSDILISAYTITEPDAAEPNGEDDPPATGDDNPPAAGDDSGLVDMKGHWAAQTVQELVDKGIISGYEDNTFRPDNLINRAECSAILARALELPAGAATLDAFSDSADVPAWAKDPVAAAVEAALLKGYPEADGSTTFRPARQVTRAELAVILSRVVVKELGEQQPAAASFADLEKIPAWALDGVNLAAEKGLVQGYPDGTFQPDKEVTRAEAAAMIARLLGVLKA
jgi:hypothetical protein